MKTVLAFLILTATAMAQAPVALPPETANMTDAQYYQWATAKNTQLRLEWEARKAKAVADQPQTLPGSVTNSSLDWTVSEPNNSNRDYYPPYNGDVYGVFGDRYGSSNATQRVQQTQTANPWYVNPGPLSTLNPYTPPRPTTEAEAAAIKKAYDEAEGEEHTVKSKDGKGVLHFKVL